MCVGFSGKSERETARPLARQLRRAVKLLIWGSRRPTPRGEQAEGAVWVKMNVKEKSTGVPDKQGGSGAQNIHTAVEGFLDWAEDIRHTVKYVRRVQHVQIWKRYVT